MAVTLLPHNEIAYKKLISALNVHQMVSINHATGTGKSFILLKYLEENKDKKILYLAPTYPIIDQLLEEHTEELGINVKSFRKFDTQIYLNLLKMNMEKLVAEYDIFVFDEYHKCGAKETQKKIMELKRIIKEKYPHKKIIGTTATEKRYLDHERSMNNILFDGVCASTLTLADAIIKGILPAPTYVILPYDLLADLNILRNKVNKKFAYQKDKDKFLKIINLFEQNIYKILEANLPKDIEGKGLVFSNTIKSISNDQKIIKKIFKNKIFKEYFVHSGQKKEKNKLELDKFKEEKTNTLLYSINILNEGLHVKGVDFIVMLRKTTSPIIFFQQLGRLLSYSRRKDNVYVFDLKNNIKRNKYIYTLFEEIVERARILLKTDPINQERYLNIIERLKVVNLSAEMAHKIDDLKTSLSTEKINEININSSIKILENFDKVNFKQSINQIFKLKDYITLEQFNKIKNYDIEKPDIFNLTSEKFEKMLCGYKNLNEKNATIKKGIKENIKIYDHFPNIFSNDDEEKLLAINIINFYNFVKEDIIIEFHHKVNNQNNIFERILCGKVLKFLSVEEEQKLLDEVSCLLKMDIKIPSVILKYIKDSEMLLKCKVHNLKYKYYIDDNKEITMSDFKFNKMEESLIYEFEVLEKLKKKSKKECAEELFLQLYVFLKSNYRFPQKSDNDEENSLYYNLNIFKDILYKLGYMQILEQIYVNHNLKIKKTELINKIIEFIEKNQELPYKNSKNVEERILAHKFNTIKKYLTIEERNKVESVLKKFPNKRQKFINRYIDFVRKNNRYPLNSSSDIIEVELMNDFEKYKVEFTKEEKTSLNNILNKKEEKEALKNAYLAMKKNRK